MACALTGLCRTRCGQRRTLSSARGDDDLLHYFSLVVTKLMTVVYSAGIAHDPKASVIITNVLRGFCCFAVHHVSKQGIFWCFYLATRTFYAGETPGLHSQVLCSRFQAYAPNCARERIREPTKTFGGGDVWCIV